MDRKSFIFYKTWAEMIKLLPREDAGELIQAICHYQTSSDFIIENTYIKAIFEGQILPQLDIDSEKYEETTRQRSEAGKKGMLKRWNDNKTITNDNTVITKDNNVINLITNDNKGITKITDNDNDNDNDNVNDNDKDTISNTNVLDCSPKPNKYVEKWNELESLGITPIKRITDKRQKLLKARLRQYGEDSFYECIDRIRESDFLQGKHKGKPWQVTFDWLILPNNYIKVLEGNYKNTKTVSGSDFLLNIINGGEG